jgi:hypothetical protein
MYFINVKICYVGLKMTDWWVETCSFMYKQKSTADVYNSFYYAFIHRNVFFVSKML